MTDIIELETLSRTITEITSSAASSSGPTESGVALRDEIGKLVEGMDASRRDFLTRSVDDELLKHLGLFNKRQTEFLYARLSESVVALRAQGLEFISLATGWDLAKARLAELEIQLSNAKRELARAVRSASESDALSTLLSPLTSPQTDSEKQGHHYIVHDKEGGVTRYDLLYGAVAHNASVGNEKSTWRQGRKDVTDPEYKTAGEVFDRSFHLSRFNFIYQRESARSSLLQEVSTLNKIQWGHAFINGQLEGRYPSGDHPKSAGRFEEEYKNQHDGKLPDMGAPLCRDIELVEEQIALVTHSIGPGGNDFTRRLAALALRYATERKALQVLCLALHRSINMVDIFKKTIASTTVTRLETFSQPTGTFGSFADELLSLLADLDFVFKRMAVNKTTESVLLRVQLKPGHNGSDGFATLELDSEKQDRAVVRSVSLGSPDTQCFSNVKVSHGKVQPASQSIVLPVSSVGMTPIGEMGGFVNRSPHGSWECHIAEEWDGDILLCVQYDCYEPITQFAL